MEFLEFLADVSHPGTGAILPSVLADRLGLREIDLYERWRMRGVVSLPEFMREILSVLDGIQDQTFDLTQTMANYRTTPISLFGSRTADQVVTAGGGRRLAVAIRKGQVSIQ